MPSPAASRANGRKSKGPPKGRIILPITRDRIRSAMLAAHMEKIALGEVIAEPHQVTAGLGLLKFCLPSLQATDLTSGGEKITVERMAFKP